MCVILPLTPSLNKHRNTLEVNWPCSQFLVHIEKPTTILKIRNSENTVTVKTVKSQVQGVQKKRKRKKKWKLPFLWNVVNSDKTTGNFYLRPSIQP